MAAWLSSDHPAIISDVSQEVTIARQLQVLYARNTIESLNNHVKDHNRESIEDSTRRLVRGFAAAQLFVTILLTNYNLRMIAGFLRKEAAAQSLADRGKQPTEPLVRRRDREYHNPYTGSYPPGVEPYAPELVGSPLKT